jgi:hypothetical protein
MEILQGEPALTIVPNLLSSGILTVLAAAFALWGLRFATHRHAAAGFVIVSSILLLVGGGFGPPLLGFVIAAGARQPSKRPSARIRSALGPKWPWFLAAAVVGYLGLMPGAVLLSGLAGYDSATLTSALTGVAFAGAVLALVAARTNDATVSSIGLA